VGERADNGNRGRGAVAGSQENTGNPRGEANKARVTVLGEYGRGNAGERKRERGGKKEKKFGGRGSAWGAIVGASPEKNDDNKSRRERKHGGNDVTES